MQLHLIPLECLSSPPVYDEIFCCSQAERQSRSFVGSPPATLTPPPADGLIRGGEFSSFKITLPWADCPLACSERGGRAAVSGISSVDGAAASLHVRHAVNSITAGFTWKHDRDKPALFAKLRQGELEGTWRIKSVNPKNLKPFFFSPIFLFPLVFNLSNNRKPTVVIVRFSGTCHQLSWS